MNQLPGKVATLRAWLKRLLRRPRGALNLPADSAQHRFIDLFVLPLEPRRVLNADFTLIGGVLDLTNFDASEVTLGDDPDNADNYRFTIDSGIWAQAVGGGNEGGGAVVGTDPAHLSIDKGLVHTIRVDDSAGGSDVAVTVGHNVADETKRGWSLTTEHRLVEVESADSFLVRGELRSLDADLSVDVSKNITVIADRNVANLHDPPELRILSRDGDVLLKAGTDVNVTSATIRTTGSGDVELRAEDGGISASISAIESTSDDESAGSLTLVGIGRSSASPVIGTHYGVAIEGTSITSMYGDISIEGDGNDRGGRGVYVRDAFVGVPGSFRTFESIIASDGVGDEAANISIIGRASEGSDSRIGVDIQDATTLILSNDGAISITGTGGGSSVANPSPGDDLVGVLISNDVEIRSTGVSNEAGGIAIQGVAGIGSDRAQGVRIDGDGTVVSSEAGTILIDGTGAGDGANSHGVTLTNGASVRSQGTASDAAKITITGKTSATGAGSKGVELNGAGTLVVSAFGDISVTGIGGLDSNAEGFNDGIELLSGAQIQSTGSGDPAANITLDGTGRTGVRLRNANTTVSSVSGDIHISGHGAGSNPFGRGVDITNEARIVSLGGDVHAAKIQVDGSTTSTGFASIGVALANEGTAIESAYGDITINGTSSQLTSEGNTFIIGTEVFGGADVRSTGSGDNAANISITGFGGRGSSSTHGVNIAEAGSSVTTVDGNVLIHGTGGVTDVPAPGTDIYNFGVRMFNGGFVETTGTGNIEVIGDHLLGAVATSRNMGVVLDAVDVGDGVGGIHSRSAGVNAGTITIRGTGGNGDSNNDGVRAIRTASITSVDGAIEISGTGNGSNDWNAGYRQGTGSVIRSTGTATIDITGTSHGKDFASLGVRLEDTNTLLESTLGDITIEGTGGPGTPDDGLTSDSYNLGVDIFTGATVRSLGTGSESANIVIDGMGGTGNNNQHGVRLWASTVTTIDGTVDITGVAGRADGGNSAGVRIRNSAILETTGLGDITIIGDVGANGPGTGDDSIASGNRGVLIQSSAVVRSTSASANAGNIAVDGTGGDGVNSNDGVRIDGSADVTSASGNITIAGTGGAGSGNNNRGVYVRDGATVAGTGSAAVTINANGGAGVSFANGFRLQTDGSAITVHDGDLRITGVAGITATGEHNRGITLANDTDITATGDGNILLSGTGGSGTNGNRGIIAFHTPTITTVSGNIRLEGFEGTGSSRESLGLFTSSLLTTGSGNIELIADGIVNTSQAISAAAGNVLLEHGSGVWVQGTVTANSVNVERTSNALNVGGPNETNGLDQTELDLLNTSTLTLAADSNIALSAPATVDSSLMFAADSEVEFDVKGASAGTTDQFVITGANRVVDINGAELSLTPEVSLNLHETIAIVDNVVDSSTVMGQFTDDTGAAISEGATITVGFFEFTISYVGGTDANDVVLTVTGVPGAQVDINGDGNLVIDDSAGSLVDTLLIDTRNDGAGGREYVITETATPTLGKTLSITTEADAAGVYREGNSVVIVPFAVVADSMTVNTGQADDRVTVDLTGGFEDTIVINGGTDSDSLTLTTSNPFTNQSVSLSGMGQDGTVDVDGYVVTFDNIATLGGAEAVDTSVQQTDAADRDFEVSDSTTAPFAMRYMVSGVPDSTNVLLRDPSSIDGDLGSLTLLGNDGENTLLVSAIGSGGGGAVPITGDLHLESETVTFAGSISTAGGGISTTAENVEVRLTAVIATGGGSFTVRADVDSDGQGDFIHNGAITTDGGSVVIAAADIEFSGTIDAGNGEITLGHSVNDSVLQLGGDGSFPVEAIITEVDGYRFTVADELQDDATGLEVSGAGDFNGDGIDDLLIAAPHYDAPAGGASHGRVFMVFGGEDNLASLDGDGDRVIDLNEIVSGTHGLRILPSTATAVQQLGFTLATVGDINGDGFDDLMASAPFGYTSSSSSGYRAPGLAHLIFGRDGGDIDLNVDSQVLQIHGVDGDRLGTSLATGDVNGDMIDDLLLAGPGVRYDSDSADRVYVVFGVTNPDVETDVAATIAVLDAADGTVDGVLNASQLTSSGGYRINTPRPVASMTVADVTGDGTADIVLGSREVDSSDSRGFSYVLFGETLNDLDTEDGTTDGRIDIERLTDGINDGVNGLLLQGDAQDRSGRIVANAGDLNGDGIDDLAVGTGYSDSQTVYVVFGGTLNLQNLDAVGGTDGIARLPDMAAVPNSGFQVTDIDAFGGEGGRLDISSAGDFNGDGLDDLLIGGATSSDSAPHGGAVHVIYGRDTDVDGDEIHEAPFASSLSVNDLDSTGFTLTGSEAYERLGYSVTGAGDINGDGVDDFSAGAPHNYYYGFLASADSPGAAYVVFGQSATPDLVIGEWHLSQRELELFRADMLVIEAPGDGTTRIVDDVLLPSVRGLTFNGDGEVHALADIVVDGTIALPGGGGDGPPDGGGMNTFIFNQDVEICHDVTFADSGSGIFFNGNVSFSEFDPEDPDHDTGDPVGHRTLTLDVTSSTHANPTVAIGNNPSDVLTLRLEGTDAETLHEQIVVDRMTDDGSVVPGQLSITAGLHLVDASGTFDLTDGTELILIENDGTEAVAGAFDTIETDAGTFDGAEGARLTFSGNDYIISYTGGDDGNDVVLTNAPPVFVFDTFVALDASGNLVIEDVDTVSSDTLVIEVDDQGNTDASDDRYLITAFNFHTVGTNIAGAVQELTGAVSVLISDVTGDSIRLVTDDGFDQVTVDLTGGSFAHDVDVQGDSTDFDRLTVVGDNPFDRQTIDLASMTDGQISTDVDNIDANGNEFTVMFQDVDEVLPSEAIDTIINLYDGVDHDITLYSHEGITVQAFATTPFDKLKFPATAPDGSPGSLTINGGDGDDTLTVELDSDYTGHLFLNGNGGDDVINLEVDTHGGDVTADAELVNINGVNTDGGNVSITANDVVFHGDMTIDAIDGHVMFTHATPDSTMVVGGSAAVGSFHISANELDAVTAASVTVQAPGIGSTQVASDLNLINTSRVTFSGDGHVEVCNDIFVGTGGVSGGGGGGSMSTLIFDQDVLVCGDATFTDSGSGVFFNGDVNFEDFADPAGTARTLTLSTAPSLIANAVIRLGDGDDALNLQLAGSNATDLHEQLIAIGSLELATALQLVVTANFSLDAGTALVLIDNQGISAVSGTFTTINGGDASEGAVVTLNGLDYVLSYTGGDGNDVTLGRVISNTDPIAEIGGPYVVDEGATITLDASGSSDVEDLDAELIFAWDLNNDGQFDDATGITTDFTGVDGPATLTVGLRVTDSGGLSATTSTTITVNNVAPVFDAGINETVVATTAGAFSRTLTFTDPGIADVHTISIDYDGNGATDDTLTPAVGDRSFDLSHTFAASGIYTVNVTVADDNGGSLTDSFVLTVDPPAIEFSSATYTVSEAAGDSMTVMLTRTGDSLTETVVRVAITGGTASSSGDSADFDATAFPIDVTFMEGETTKAISLPIVDDDVVELDETILLSVVDVSNAVIGAENAAKVTLENNDTSEITVDVLPTPEGDVLNFVVTLSQAVDVDTTVEWSTSDGTASGATDGSGDYVSATNQTLTILAGQTTGSILVATTKDDLVEYNETLSVTLSNVNAAGRNVQLFGAEGFLSTEGIINDDDVFRVSIDDVTRVENADGGTTTDFVFTVSASNESVGTHALNYFTIDGTATATDGDYNPIVGGTLTFDPGKTSQQITVTVNNDDIVEDDESFQLRIQDLTSDGLAVATDDFFGDATIANDDNSELSISNAVVAEGGNLAFTVTLSNAVDVDTEVTYSTVTDSADNTDFIEATDQTITIAAGDTTGTITIVTTADDIVEADETLTVRLTDATADGRYVNTFGAEGCGTIEDNDEGTWSVTGSGSADEGSDAEVSINLAGRFGIGESVSVIVTQTESTDADFITRLIDIAADRGDVEFDTESNRLTFTAQSDGDEMEAIDIVLPVEVDGLIEGDEAVTVELSDPLSTTTRAAKLEPDSQAIQTIVTDADGPALWSIAGTESADEGSSADFTVSLEGAFGAGERVSVLVAHNDQDTNAVDLGEFESNTAELFDSLEQIADTRDNLEFDGTTGALTFVSQFDGDNLEAVIVSVNIQNDGFIEGVERFQVALSSATTETGAAVGIDVNAGEHTSTINDTQGPGGEPDGPAQWSLAGPDSVDEGGTATFEISLIGNFGEGEVAAVRVTQTDAGTSDDDLGAGGPNQLELFNSLTTIAADTPELNFDQGSGELTFTAQQDGDTFETIQLKIAVENDDAVEGDESFEIELTSPSGSSGTGYGIAGTGRISTLIADSQGVGGPPDEQDSNDFGSVAGFFSGSDPVVSNNATQNSDQSQPEPEQSAEEAEAINGIAALSESESSRRNDSNSELVRPTLADLEQSLLAVALAANEFDSQSDEELYFQIVRPDGSLGEKISLSLEMLERDDVIAQFARFPQNVYRVMYHDGGFNTPQQLFELSVQDGKVVPSLQPTNTDNVAAPDVENDPPERAVDPTLSSTNAANPFHPRTVAVERTVTSFTQPSVLVDADLQLTRAAILLRRHAK